MACVKFLAVFVLLSVVNSSTLIYRKYEKQHPKKNYVQIVEIFGTNQQPPHYTKSDKELNDFLARDSYKTDMNCTKANETESVETTTSATPTTVTVTRTITRPTIPTTAFRRVTATTKSTQTRTPNLNELFTIPARPTKPTIKPNPKENSNPDYTNVIPWQSPNVQVTKHPPRTNTTTLLIQETDDHPTNNRTTLRDVDREMQTSRKPIETTTKVSSAELDDEVIYKSGEDDEGEYNEGNYPDVIPSNEFEAPLEGTELSDDEYDNDGEDYDEEQQKRRKRQKTKRLTVMKRKNTVKS